MDFIKLLDLFCGAGGLSLGFSKAGFQVTGVDINPKVERVFSLNSIGKTRTLDLSEYEVDGSYDVVIGGPPCRPWSRINVTKRGRKNKDYSLLSRFFSHVESLEPSVFLMENVPPVEKSLVRHIRRIRRHGYLVASQVISYGDFGASTSRHRLIVVGSRNGVSDGFFKEISKYHREPGTVRHAIGFLDGAEDRSDTDHVYPRLKTIHKYREYYRTGKFGWHILKWDCPAPSFGNVMKTYTLHPSSWNGAPPRVISIREALLIMGFNRGFSFPKNMAMNSRYQMVADSVSPRFSYAAARVIKEMLQ